MANKKAPAGTILCAGCRNYDELTRGCEYGLTEIADRNGLTVWGCDFGYRELRKTMADYHFWKDKNIPTLSDEDFIKRMFVTQKGERP